MPTAPPRPCAHPGCAELTHQGRCDKHRQSLRKEADARRESSSKRGYGSRWQKARAGWLRAHPLCVHCERAGEVTLATDVDHIVPVNGPSDPGFWRASNWQSLCHACHSVKTSTEDGGFGRPTA